MTKRPSIDEIVAKRKTSADADGKLYKAVILDDVEAKGYNSEARSQRFIMSTESVDLYGDIVRQDGIKTDNFERNPVALAFHMHTAPIGWWKDVSKVNGRPKRTEGVLTLHASGTTDAVDEIERLLAANAIKACSIGFMPLEAEWILDDEGRNTWGLDFKESSLLECSVCSVPANPDALAKAAGGDMRLAAELFERFLDTYCEKTAGGIVVRKDFADAYMAMKAPKTTVTASAKKDGDAVSTLRVELDLEEAERQAEGFVEKWSKKFADLFKSPEEKALDQVAKDIANLPLNLIVERPPIKLVDKEGDDLPTLIGEWPAKSRISVPLVEGKDMPLADDDGVITIRTMKSFAEYRIVAEKDGAFDVDLIRSYDPPPALVSGSRQKAVVASARIKQSLRERGLLT